MNVVAELARPLRQFGQSPNAPAAPSFLAQWRALCLRAFRVEIDERRLFLWVPVCGGAGAITHLLAAQEANLVFTLALTLVFAVSAVVLRGRAIAYRCLVALAAFLGGMSSAGLRNVMVAAPILQRPMVAQVSGFLEEVDHRHQGARFILRVTRIEGLDEDVTPFRVRLTTKRDMRYAAGDHVSLRARLVPPARASIPNGYDFARDAFYARLGAVGSVIGNLEVTPATHPADLKLRFYATVDRARNALAKRVEQSIGGPAGAIGAAMVTGKRDYLDDPTREVIREAGIFHIITIAGVQMTLVAGIFFWGLRRLLALSPTLALHYPIKKWAAALAIIAAIIYDIGTGSRVGTDRALYMTLIMLGAVLFDRQAFSMRNLALAAGIVVLVEPEALLGASFQLSFAAVAGLIAVWELRMAARNRAYELRSTLLPSRVDRNDRFLLALDRLRHGPLAMLLSTICATAATTSFMAYDFHELSPYVLLGNPLTLTIIEVFAVPAALLGSFLFPLGLDGWVWTYLGWGIDFIMWIARWISTWPGATIHLKAFAPWSLNFLALAMLSAVLWRSLFMKLTALPLLALGIYGAALGDPFDVAISPQGDAMALRNEAGHLDVLGRRPGTFLVEQWLRADGDGRAAKSAIVATPSKAEQGADRRCDKFGCVARLPDGRSIALVLERQALAHDCARADIIITGLSVPTSCAASFIIDRERLYEWGAVTLRITKDQIIVRSHRSAQEDRPWSPAQKRLITRNENGAPVRRAIERDEPESDSYEPPPFR